MDSHPLDDNSGYSVVATNAETGIERQCYVLLKQEGKFAVGESGFPV